MPTDWSGTKILLCNKIVSAEVIRLVMEQNIRQLIQNDNPHFAIEVQSAITMAKTPEAFFDFPLSTVLSPQEPPSRELESKLRLLELSFNRSDQKEDLLSQIGVAVKSLCARQSLIQDTKLVSDELISNAIYNAPFASEGLVVDRKSDVVTDPEKSGRLMIGADAGRLVLVCEDSYGSLNLDAFVARLKKCADVGKGEVMNFDKGGAGIGTYMIFETCMSLYVGVLKSQKTIFACVFPTNKANRYRTELGKNIHFVGKK